MIRADPDSDEEVEVARWNTLAGGRTDDLLELLDRIEAEGLHAMAEIGVGDRFLGLYRVHEAEFGLGQGIMDESDFADRGDVIVSDAGIPEDLEEVGRGVRFHCI